MTTLWQDILYGLRMLAKRPATTGIAAISLALGIGLNTAIFTLVHTVLLGALPYREPSRLVALSSIPPGHPDQPNGISVPDYFAMKEQAKSLEEIGGLANVAADFGAEEGGVSAERLQGENVTPESLRSLGVQPIIGRLFTDDEEAIDHPANVIILSHRLWIRRFGGEKDILNRKILVNDIPTQVIGVMPPDFRFTDEEGQYLGLVQFNRFQLRGSARFLFVTARLKPGVSFAQAQTEMDTIAGRLAQQYPQRDSDHGKPWGIRAQPLPEALFGFLSRPLFLLQGAVGFVLLIACANVAALLLALAQSRRTEVAIRASLGAGQGRIFRQFLTESLLLSLFSGVLGVVLAFALVRVLVAMAPTWLPRLHAIHLDTEVLAFSAVASLLTGLIFGLLPALQGSKLTFIETLKDATRGGTEGGSRARLRAILVTGQIALALVLLVGSGLLIRSFVALQGASIGCDPHGLLTFQYRYPGREYSKVVGSYHGYPLWEMNHTPRTAILNAFDRLQHLPGIVSAAGVVYPPFTGSYSTDFTIEGRTAANPDDFSADFEVITPHFFTTMKIPVIRGRDFNDRDTSAAQWVAIINETAARKYFPNEDPIGKHVRFDISEEDQNREIIAVVGDIPANFPQTKIEPAIYTPFAQSADHSIGTHTGFQLQLAFLLRTQSGDPISALPAVRRTLEEFDRNRPLVNPRTLDAYLAILTQYPRYYSMLFGLFAFVATALAAVGIYGVIAHSVAQRTREIGIRTALGATGRDVLKLIGRQIVIVIAVGAIVGIAAALTLTRYISSVIWEVKAADPAIYIGVTLLLIAVALTASLAPVRRAIAVDPKEALHYE